MPPQEDLDKGVYVHQMIAPQDRERAAESIAGIFDGKAPSGSEYTALMKGGDTFPVMIYSSPTIKEGRPAGLRGIVVDITQLKEAEKAKAGLEARVQQAEESAGVGCREVRQKTILATNAGQGCQG